MAAFWKEVCFWIVVLVSMPRMRGQDVGVRSAQKLAQFMSLGRGWNSTRMGMKYLQVGTNLCRKGSMMWSHLALSGISAANALQALTTVLERLRVANAKDYRTHDLRRGHALDLQLSGAGVCVRQVLWLWHFSYEVLRGAAVEDLRGRGMAVTRIPELSRYKQVISGRGCSSAP